MGPRIDISQITSPRSRAGETGSDLLPTIDGYRLLKPIGQGGQGRVFQALRLCDNKKVAVKIILPGRLSDLPSRARFEEEWRTLELLDHPGIVRVLDHGSLDSGELWYAAEYIDGVPVNQYVHDLDRIALAQAGSSIRHSFPLAKVLDLFTRICEGVEAAHQAGVLHRDLKPANILVDDDGRPHILDFGLARSPQRESPDAVTLTGQFMGSPAWSSPEQIEARPSLIDARTDVYSLGMMFYHALTGDFPFDVNQSWPRLFEAIRHAEPTPPREIRPFIDHDLQTIALTAIAKEKHRRYPSVAAFREDIKRYQTGRPILARNAGRLYRLTKFIRRNRLLVASIVVGAGLTSSYTVSVTYMYRQSEHHAADARAKFRAARESLDFTLSQVDHELAKVAGASSIRRVLLERGFVQLDSLLKEKSDDPELQADIAKTHARLADIAQSLGRWDRAAEEVAAALEIRRKLAAQMPGHAESQAELSIALVRVGDIARGRGERDNGQALYEQALAIDEALVAAYPHNLHYLDNLSWSYDRLCWAALLEEDAARAKELHEKRLRIARRLVELEPTNPARKRNLLLAYAQSEAVETLGLVLKDPPLAERAEAASRLSTELLAQDPNNMEYLRCLAGARRMQSAQEVIKGRYGEAMDRLREALSIIDGVLAVEPDDREWRWLQIVAFYELAFVARRAGSPDAGSLLAQSLQNGTDLAARFPADLEVKDRLAAANGELGLFRWEQGRQEEGRQLLREEIRLRRENAEHPAAKVEHFRALAGLLATCPAADLRDSAAALRWATRAVERSHHRSPQSLRFLAIAQEAAGQTAEARRTACDALALLHPGQSQLRKTLEELLASCMAPANSR